MCSTHWQHPSSTQHSGNTTDIVKAVEKNFKALSIPENWTLINLFVGTTLSIVLSHTVTLSKSAETNWGDYSISQRYCTHNALSACVFSCCIPQKPGADPLLMRHREAHIRSRKHFKDDICQSGYLTRDCRIQYITVSFQTRKVLLN